MSNVETIKQLYEAFGRGDIPGVLEQLAEDVRWEQWPTGNAAQEQDVPYMRPRSGREAVGGFFQDIQEDFEMNSFNPHSFLEGEDRVAVLIEVDLTVKSTGKRLQDEGIHLWGFGSDGKVTSHRHFLDTAKAIDAHS
jgi:ketosteroid isomerase-like protein